MITYRDIKRRAHYPTFVGQCARLFVLLCSLVLAACYRSAPNANFALAETSVDELSSDSLSSGLVRDYGVGYNFIVDADSVLLLEDRPAHWSEGAVETSDSLWLRRSDAIVVAAFLVIPEDSVDSVWVKVARDQLTMGWLHEGELLAGSYPDDPISAFIYLFSSRHMLWFWLIMAAVALMIGVRLVRRKELHLIHIADIPTAYPTLLLITLASATLLYGHIQHASPQLWVQFYFHPTLNPLAQPRLICIFLLSVWLLLLLAIATVNNVVGYLQVKAAFIYLFALTGMCVLVYLVFSLTASTIFGYLLFAAYVVYALYRYWTHSRALYLCGNCGAKLRSKGVCPKCGAVND